MLSPVFWLSLLAVFFGVKWLADGLMSLARVQVRHATATRTVPRSSPKSVPWQPADQDAVAVFENAA